MEEVAKYPLNVFPQSSFVGKSHVSYLPVESKFWKSRTFHHVFHISALTNKIFSMVSHQDGEIRAFARKKKKKEISFSIPFFSHIAVNA